MSLSPATRNLIDTLGDAVQRLAGAVGYEETASDVKQALFDFRQEQAPRAYSVQCGDPSCSCVRILGSSQINELDIKIGGTD